ncbi:hypothetical protein ACEPAI_7361 [Sanghuangporus weigelae]
MTRTRSPIQILAFFVLATFLTCILFLGISQEVENYTGSLKGDVVAPGQDSSFKEKPDFNRYIWRRTLSGDELDFDKQGRRILFIGDIHGMKESFDKLLKKANYNRNTDHLIHVGDIVAKGPLDGSLDVLAFMTKNNISGIRGNHDQMVIGWRAWIENVLSQSGGRYWLEKLEKKNEKERKAYLKHLRKALKKGKGEVWKRIPDDWEFMGDHYTVARTMNDEQSFYLRNLPLVMHIPRLHAFVVHAGLLPLDPRRSATSARQPLSRVPEDEDKGKGKKKDVVERLRVVQEEGILSDVPQNNDPWNVMNVRSILKDNSISRDSKAGSAWAPLWNSIVSRCGGFNLDLDYAGEDDLESFIDEGYSGTIKSSLQMVKEKPLPCYPSTVVYGHAASRGLDIRRWTKGLDTGCVYGRRLTTLVLSHSSSSSTDPSYNDDDASSGNENDDDDDEHSLSRKKKMRFGDPDWTSISTRIVSVSCPDL